MDNNDLIRREDVIKELWRPFDFNRGDIDHNVRYIPAVDAVEVVHAYWIDIKGTNGKDYHKCSNCLHEQEITGIKNYCAVCGARMDGKEEHNASD